MSKLSAHRRAPPGPPRLSERLKMWDYSIHVPVSPKNGQLKTLRRLIAILGFPQAVTQLYINTLRRGAWVNRHAAAAGSPLHSWLTLPLLFTEASNLHRGSGGLARLATRNTPYWRLTATDGSNSKYFWSCYGWIKRGQGRVGGQNTSNVGSSSNAR